MRTITATEASRSFAALLDEVEQGETVIITRGGRRVATIGPAVRGNGAALLALLTSGAAGFDPGFEADVAAARDAVDDQEPAWLGD